MKFRISGQGKKLYGDGIALWVTQQRRFNSGMVFGSTDVFTGFGILLDTFRNTESGHVHKDISLVISNGQNAVDMDSDRPGCDSDYRFFEGRDDFSVSQSKSQL